MKGKMICIIVLISFAMLFSGFSKNCFGQEYYEQGEYRLVRSSYDRAYINGIDSKILAENLFPEFKLYSIRANLYWGRFCSYSRESDDARLYIRIGVYESVLLAEDTALDFLNSVSAFFEEGPINNENIGDNCWFNMITPSGKSPIVHSITFLRKNVFIAIHCDYDEYNIDLLSLAKSIDNCLINETSYITFVNKLSPPVIESISVSKRGDDAEITVFASDPQGKAIQYDSGFYVTKNINLPYNVFLVRKNIIMNSEFKTFDFWVINQDNFFSRITKVERTFLIASAVADEGMTAESPQAFTLHRNTPNPFNSGTVIGYELARPASVSLRVYDMLGREVTVLDEGMRNRGKYNVSWDGTNKSGRPAASGVYFYRLESGGQAEARRMTLVR